MARGFDSVKEAGRDIEERKNALGDGDFTPRVYFKIAARKICNCSLSRTGRGSQLGMGS
jgi:hypothetical protein